MRHLFVVDLDKHIQNEPEGADSSAAYFARGASYPSQERAILRRDLP